MPSVDSVGSKDPGNEEISMSTCVRIPKILSSSKYAKSYRLLKKPRNYLFFDLIVQNRYESCEHMTRISELRKRARSRRASHARQASSAPTRPRSETLYKIRKFKYFPKCRRRNRRRLPTAWSTPSMLFFLVDFLCSRSGGQHVSVPRNL